MTKEVIIIKELPKTLEINQWSYKENSIKFNGVTYKTENIIASNISVGDVIVVTNGATVEGIGEVTRIEQASKLDKFRNVIPLVFINTKLNYEGCSSYAFYAELSHFITKIIL